MKWSLALASILSLCFSLTACEGEGGDCTEDQCSGSQIQHCLNGTLGEPEDCEDGMMCMTMDNGMQHCMLMGDDDDSGMNMGR